jgi:hypothetical protein
MFHVELRKFPHNSCSFNLTEAELAQIVLPWSRMEWIELGERKWNPHEARLTILEGPHLPLDELQIGRGWHNAQHQSTDVTERVLVQARASQVEAGAGSGAPPSFAAGRLPGNEASAAVSAASPPDTALHALLGPDPTALLQAWQLASQRRPELSPSETLALAESTLRSLDANAS